MENEARKTRVLIAITSCGRDRKYQDAQRNTWIKDIPAGVDYKFFLGHTDATGAKDDEVFLNVPDTYAGLPFKTQALLEWALEHGYDFIYKTDVDTLVCPVNLLGCGFEHYAWVGANYGARDKVFASGGSGYWLSADAARKVVAFKASNGAEDVMVANVMRANGIDLHHDDRYLFAPGSVLDGNTISYHLSSVFNYGRGYKPEYMYSSYAKFKAFSLNPTVSVICPTADRQHLIPMAIQCFLDQDYYSSEMVIVDDGAEPTRVPYNSRIKLVRLDTKMTIGAKINIGCECALGNNIVRFDDDDWSAPGRIAQQVQMLDKSSVVSYNSLSLYNVKHRTAARLDNAAGLGTGQAFRKAFWKHNHFVDCTGGEDGIFYGCAQDAVSIPGDQMIVVRRHDSNTWAGGNAVAHTKNVSLSALPNGFLKALGLTIGSGNPVTVPHAHHGYCKKHKALGCAICTLEGNY
jgi:hypothetical protein